MGPKEAILGNEALVNTRFAETLKKGLIYGLQAWIPGEYLFY
jgi:hypothetical protein